MASALIEKNTKAFATRVFKRQFKNMQHAASSQYQIYADKQFDPSRNDTRKK